MTCSNEECDKERQFDEQQYDDLVNCCHGAVRKIGDPAAMWNRRYGHNSKTDIRLEGANLRGLRLTHPQRSTRYYFEHAMLRGADFTNAHFEQAIFKKAKLRDAVFEAAHLFDCNFRGADLRHARLKYSDLKAANLDSAEMKGANFFEAYVTGRTILSEGPHREQKVDTQTDFRGTAVPITRIDPELLGQLQYNCRRLEWEEWYQRHKVLAPFVKLFWHISDYGRSTRRILVWFLLFSVIFGAFYFVLATLTPPGPVHRLTTYELVTEQGKVIQQRIPEKLVVLSRALYFSVVTMTTLGFGDLHAAPTDLLGHWLLMLQVCIGYILLGALITRFAIMFQGSVGPVRKPELGQNASHAERVEDLLCKLLKGETSGAKLRGVKHLLLGTAIANIPEAVCRFADRIDNEIAHRGDKGDVP